MGRKEKYNQETIAKKLGITKQRVSQMFGNKVVYESTYKKIAKAMPELAECFEPTKYKFNREKYLKLKKKLDKELIK